MTGWALILLLLTACSHPVYAVTSGSHVPGERIGQAGGLVERVVIWANHPAATEYLTSMLLPKLSVGGE